MSSEELALCTMRNHRSFSSRKAPNHICLLERKLKVIMRMGKEERWKQEAVRQLLL